LPVVNLVIISKIHVISKCHKCNYLFALHFLSTSIEQMVVTHVDKYNVEFRKHGPYDGLIMDDVIKNILVTRQML